MLVFPSNRPDLFLFNSSIIDPVEYGLARVVNSQKISLKIFLKILNPDLSGMVWWARILWLWSKGLWTGERMRPLHHPRFVTKFSLGRYIYMPNKICEFFRLKLFEVNWKVYKMGCGLTQCTGKSLNQYIKMILNFIWTWNSKI